jgi:hypothetical protein
MFSMITYWNMKTVGIEVFVLVSMKSLVSMGCNTVQLGSNLTVRRYIFRARDWAKKENRRQVDLKYMLLPISVEDQQTTYMKTEFFKNNSN